MTSVEAKHFHPSPSVQLAAALFLLGACQSQVTVNAEATSEVNCADRIDNDQDGLTDCADADCAGSLRCNPSSGGCTPRQTGYVTDRTAYAWPTLPTLPASGGTFTDPVFGTTIMRLTDAADGNDNEVAYAYWPTFNKGSTRLAIQTPALGFTVFDFDPATFQVLGKAALPDSPTGGVQFEDATWSNLDPDVLFAHTLNGRLYSYDFGTSQYTLVKDFNAELPGEYQWQMSKSADDDVFAFTRRLSSDYSVVGYVVWRGSTSTLLPYAEPPEGVDEVRIDKTGQFLFVGTTMQGVGAIEGYVRDLLNNTVTGLTDDGPDFNATHYDLGTGTSIGNDNWNNRLTKRQLAAPHNFVTVLDMGNDWTLADHLSFLADDESWILLSFYSGDPPGVLRGEIVQVATDQSQNVRRLAHHRSVFTTYNDTPRANISFDGCFVAFTSNWGNSGRRDVFLLDLSE